MVKSSKRQNFSELTSFISASPVGSDTPLQFKPLPETASSPDPERFRLPVAPFR